MAATLLGAGCATRQAAQPPTPAPVVEKKLDGNVIEAARSNIGVPYKFGGNSPQTGFDCSGLVCWSYEQVGISLPRRARDQLMFGIPVEKQRLQPGDIVVFKGTRGRSGWHSGIYTGDGMFIHSPSSGKAVTETSLDDAYYARRYAGASRVPHDAAAAADLFAAYREKERAAANAARVEKKAAGKKTTVASAKNKRTGKSVAGGKDRKTARKPSQKPPQKSAQKSARKSASGTSGTMAKS